MSPTFRRISMCKDKGRSVILQSHAVCHNAKNMETHHASKFQCSQITGAAALLCALLLAGVLYWHLRSVCTIHVLMWTSLNIDCPHGINCDEWIHKVSKIMVGCKWACWWSQIWTIGCTMNGFHSLAHTLMESRGVSKPQGWFNRRQGTQMQTTWSLTTCHAMLTRHRLWKKKGDCNNHAQLYVGYQSILGHCNDSMDWCVAQHTIQILRVGQGVVFSIWLMCHTTL